MKTCSIALLVTFLFLTTSAHGSIIYDGQLAWDDQADPNPLDTLGSWSNDDTIIAWSVEQLDGGDWRYNYRLSVSGKDVSHIIFETSESLESVWNVSANVDVTWEFDLYTPDSHGSSNPGLPGDMYGVKFDIGRDTQIVEISFEAARQPVWGDFYAKAGSGKKLSYVYNAGFSPDSPGGTASVPQAHRILVPDTVNVPEPAAMMMLTAPAAALLLRRRTAR